MKRPHQESGLRYATGDDVRIGDRVRMKRLFGRDILAAVCYIPGISPRHSSLEYDDVKQWALRGEDGSVYPILYDPATFQPPRKIVLLERGETIEMPPPEELL